MSPHLEIVRSRDTIVVRVRGPVILGRGARPLRDIVQRAIASGHRVALDLTRVTHMDAHGIGVIAGLCAAARDAGSSVALAGASPRVARLLSLTHLDSLIPQFVPLPSHVRAATPRPATFTAR